MLFIKRLRDRVRDGRDHLQRPRLAEPARPGGRPLPDGRGLDRDRLDRVDRLCRHHARARARIRLRGARWLGPVATPATCRPKPGW